MVRIHSPPPFPAVTKNQILELQKAVGTSADGFWGPKSTAAAKRHLRKLMPSPNPWPKSDEASIRAFFGPPGEQHLTNLPVSHLPVFYLGSRVKTIRCHKLVAPSFERVLSKIASGPSREILRKYAGCFNLRPMRGGSRLSTHSWGIAIDLDPGNNGNRVHWPCQAKMPLDVMEAFAREGWTPAGAFWSRDAMHFQATSP